jgi:putative DNA primase/helicase
MSADNPLLKAAHEYAARGWFVNACKPDSKAVAFSDDEILAHATRDPAVIDKWWGRQPKSNLGLVPGKESGFAVLDVDVKHGQQGYEILADVEKATGPWPRTRREKTPSGGEHIYFQHPGIVRNLNSESVGPKSGLEYFGKPSNLVAAPSIVDKKPYYVTDDSDVAVMPDALIEFIQTWSTKAAGSKHSKVIPNHQRNKTLYSFACSLRARSTVDATAWQLLQERNLDCAPPLGERELKTIFKSAWKHEPGFKLTDLGNAERLVANCGEDLLYVQGGGWSTWDAHRWNLEQAQGRVMVMLADVVRGMYVDASKEEDQLRRKRLVDHATSSESRKRLDAAVALAQWQPSIVSSVSDFDKDPLLIGLQNGVYDLGRNEFREGRREDRILLQANVAYDPKATAPRWQRFQQEIHKGDPDLESFKQRAWGYTLSGDTTEQVLFLPYGEGSNGKSTELSIMLSLFGDYAKKVEPETLLVSDKRGGASNDVARLRGARFVATVEVEDGGRMAESLIKQLTGEDTLTSRYLYKEFFQFQPVCKIWIASNHKPEITGTDYAIWRRILLIPYLVKFEGASKDARLKQTLQAELPGILNWMISGFREWQRIGLAAPKAVTGATQEYRDDMDRVGNFLRECCKHAPGTNGKTGAAKLYRNYVGWMKFCGLKAVSARKFHERMERDHGLFRKDGDGGKLRDYDGVLLITREYDDVDM